MKEISPQTYQQFRDRLSALLEKAVQLPGLLTESASQLETVRKKLFENQFEVALVGEFQGGKSTTFNNICDAREISPRGKGGGGLKTSGCIVRAQNLSDPSAEEHAIVRWRTPDELLKGFDEILRRDQQSPTLYRGKTPDDPGGAPVHEGSTDFNLGIFDLNSAAGRNRICEAAQIVKASWEQNPTLFDPDDIGLVDLIRFALLTAHFYNSPFIKEIRGKERFAIQDIQSLVTFPEDWLSRWSEWNPAKFQPEEIVFAFVASVDCRIKSKNLSRLGCAITDCPGLFASNWDSQVATEALTRADAVLYLIDGDKQLKLNDLKAMRSLTLGSGMIFVGANCQTLPWPQTERIRAANSELLAKQGWGIEGQNIRCFNAALGLFARHVEKGVDMMDPLAVASLQSDFRLAPTDGPLVIQQHLIKKIGRFWESMDNDFDRNAFEIQRASDAYKQSRMPDLLEAVEVFVLARKSRSILLGNGEKVRVALSETEVSLRITEENAIKRFDEREAEFRLAESALRDFESASNALVETFGTEAAELLAKSFWDQLEYDQEAFLDEFSATMAKELSKVHWKLIKDREEVVRILKSHAQRLLDRWIVNQSKMWLANIRDGKNSSYNATIARSLRDVHRQMEMYWSLVLRKQIPGLEGIVIPVLDEMRVGDGAKLPPSFISGITNELDKLRTNNFFAGVGALLAGGMTLLVVLGYVASPVLPLVIPILVAFFPALKGLIYGGSKTLIRKDLQVKFAELKSVIIEQVGNEVTTLVGRLQERLNNKAVQYPRKVYQRRKTDSEKQFKMAESDRIRVAQEAKEAREQHVSPLRVQCENYLTEAELLFANESA